MNHPSRRLIAIPVLLVLAVVAWALFHRGGGGSLVATGTVEATEASLGFTVPGRLERVRVHEGDTVALGAPLASLDLSETAARRDQAAAQAAAADAQLRELTHGARPEEITQARAAAAAASAQLDEARREADRERALKAGNAVAQRELDAALTALKDAQSNDTQARQQQRLVESGPREERIETARAQLAAAEASVRSLDAALAHMEVRAPFAGVVTVRHHEPGEIVAAGSPVISLLDRNDRWVRIYIPENRIGAVRIGQGASLAADTYPGRRYRGSVMAIASEAEFTPKTVQTREERVKLVYGVKVRILEDRGYELKPGMPVDVTLEAGSR